MLLLNLRYVQTYKRILKSERVISRARERERERERERDREREREIHFIVSIY